MRVAIALLAATSSIAACKSAVEEDAPKFAVFTSGSRLRANVLVVDDDVHLFESWRDTKLGVDCTFTPMDDGVERCVPADTYVNFLDAACTKPVYVRWNPCKPLPTHASSRRVDGCGYKARAFRVKPEPLPDVKETFVMIGSSCVSEGLMWSEVHAVEPIAPTELVSAQVVDGGVHGGVGLRVREAADGAKEMVSYVGADGRACRRVEITDGGENVCTPDDAAFDVGGFADATCKSTPAAVLSPHSCTATAPGIVYASERIDDCHARTVLYAVGPELRSPIYQSQTDGTCGKTFDGTAGGWFGFGPKLDPASFPHFATRTVGAHLRVTQWLAGDLVVEQHLFGDGDKRCAVGEWDGAPRCASIGIDWPYYADAACTDHIARVFDTGCGDGATAMALTTTDRCAQPEVHAYGEAYVGPVFEKTSDGACKPSMHAGDKFARIGPQLHGDAIGKSLRRITE